MIDHRFARPVPLAPEDDFKVVHAALADHYPGGVNQAADADHFRRLVRPRPSIGRSAGDQK